MEQACRRTRRIFPALVAVGCAAAAFELGNETIGLTFATETGGGLCGLRNGACGVEFLDLPPAAGASVLSPWLLVVRGPSGGMVSLTAADAGHLAHRTSGRLAELVWSDVRHPDLAGSLGVTATVSLGGTTGRTLWDLAVSGTMEGVLWDVHFPRVMGIRGPPHNAMAVPQYLGRIVRDAAAQKTGYSLDYPQPASMQWTCYWGTPDRRLPVPEDSPEGVYPVCAWRPDERDAAGIYLAAEDGDGWHKRLVADVRVLPGRVCWWIEHLPPLAAWPPPDGPVECRYELPYTVVLAAYRGDCHEAAALYRSWAVRQPWCRRGPAWTWPVQSPAAGSVEQALWTPSWFREVGFWAKFYHEPAKVLPEWAAYRKWLRVPMASHYYRYTVARFDDNYPEPLPADPYLLPGMRAAREMGIRPLPYINGVIWDTDTQSWLRENGLAAAIKDPDGAFIPWDIHGEIFAHMCPVEPWRAKMRETTRKLVWEQGMSGVYLDCLAATAAKPCHDPAHGHPLRGGDYRAKGNRTLLQALRQDIRRLTPDACFFTEEIGEQYLDVMDGFLTLDLMRSASRRGEEVFPLFGVVYHPFTLNFGSDAQIDQDPERFCLEVGTLFTWGCVPLISAPVAVPPRPGDRNSEFLREVVQAYALAGRRFLQEGQWERLVIRPAGAPGAGESGLELRTAEHRVRYSKRRGQEIAWSGPAVLGSAWRREDALGIVLVNITDRPQKAVLTWGPQVAAGSRGQTIRQLWPGLSERSLGDGQLDLDLGPGGVAILASETPVPAPERPQLDTCAWELITAEDGAFPEFRGPAGGLWACSDAPLRHRFEGEGPCAVTALGTDRDGRMVPRRGRTAAVTGAAAEGTGLPRRHDEQPFLLLRPLPHNVAADTAAEITVLGADEDWLHCRVTGACTIRFAEKGMLLLRRPDGTVTSVGSAAEARLEGTGSEVVFLARRTQALEALPLRFAAAGLGGAEGEVLRRCLQQLWDSPDAAGTALLSRALAAVVEAARGVPALLAPDGPVVPLAARVRSLVDVLTGSEAHLSAVDDWLSPGLPKDVWLRPAPGGGAHTLQWLASGPWANDAVVLEPLAAPGAVGARLRLAAPDHVERLLPLAAIEQLPSPGGLCARVSFAWFTVSRPVLLDVPAAAIPVVAGRAAEVEAVLRNASPEEVLLTPEMVLPEGWEVTVPRAPVRLPPLAVQSTRIGFRVPGKARSGMVSVFCRYAYAEGAGHDVRAVLRVAVQDELGMLLSPKAGTTQPSPARLRRGNTTVFAMKEGERAELTVRNVRVTIYSDPLRVQVLDSDLRPVAERRIEVDGSASIAVQAAREGLYRVVLDAGSGSAEIEAGPRVVAEEASRRSPLHLFCSPVQRWFYVPRGASGFRIAVQDGGIGETARLRLEAPGGRVAFEGDGAWNGGEHPVAVLAGEDGAVWALHCHPVQDVSLWLDGDVCPFLSPVPAEVPAPLWDMGHP
ncbi:MAG: hypothetical protein JXR77_02375 [Lentisphaeria bacterium]|nr:hypothetical protein [Lentisphaeria bacterium]